MARGLSGRGVSRGAGSLRVRVSQGAEGVRGVADVEGWLGEVGAGLGVPVDEVLAADVQDGILALTGDIAHNVVRLAVPLTSYLIGVAVGRGASPQEALAIVAGLVPPGEK
jgi:hypothetical protein